MFGDIALNVTNANEKMMLIQGMIGSKGFSDDLFLLETAALADSDSVLKQQEIFLKEKSRVKLLAEGDWNSNFFHSLLKRRGGKSHFPLFKLVRIFLMIQLKLVSMFSHFISISFRILATIVQTSL